MSNEWTPIARLESQHNQCRVYEDFFLCFGGRYERQWNAIRIAAITLASDSAIIIARLQPSKMICHSSNLDHILSCTPACHHVRLLIWATGRMVMARKAANLSRPLVVFFSSLVFSFFLFLQSFLFFLIFCPSHLFPSPPWMLQEVTKRAWTLKCFGMKGIGISDGVWLLSKMWMVHPQT